MKKIETPLGDVYQLSDNLIKAVIKLAKVDDLELVKQHMQMIRDHFGAKSFYLSDTRLVKHTSMRVRKYLAEHATVSAAAILAKNSVTVMLANVFINFSKPPYPTKLFKEEADAIAWLIEQGAQPLTK